MEPLEIAVTNIKNLLLNNGWEVSPLEEARIRLELRNFHTTSVVAALDAHTKHCMGVVGDPTFLDGPRDHGEQ